MVVNELSYGNIVISTLSSTNLIKHDEKIRKFFQLQLFNS